MEFSTPRMSNDEITETLKSLVFGNFNITAKDREALDTAISMIETITPLNPVYDKKERVVRCPKCNRIIGTQFNFCPTCGQKIEWFKYPKPPELVSPLHSDNAMNDMFYMQFSLKVLDVIKTAEPALTVSEYRKFLESVKKLADEKLETLKEEKSMARRSIFELPHSIQDHSSVVEELEHCLQKREDEHRSQLISVPMWAIEDAITLLKPRVLEWSEIKDYDIVWIEIKWKKDMYPSQVSVINDKVMCWNPAFTIDERYKILVSDEEDRKHTRCWNLKPTDEERENTSWG